MPVHSRLALLVPVGAILFTVSWLVLGAISPGYELFGTVIAPYSWVSQPVSGLGLGVTGPWMNGAFIVGGILVLVGTLASAGVWRSLGRRGIAAAVLMSLMGVGMIACGAFTLEAMMLHLLGFLLAIPLPAVGFIFAGGSCGSSTARSLAWPWAAASSRCCSSPSSWRRSTRAVRAGTREWPGSSSDC
nr:hypothetical protein GCM10025699_16130 [Microbacterium flavescens]